MKVSKEPRAGDYVKRCPLLYVMELIGSKWKLRREIGRASCRERV